MTVEKVTIQKKTDQLNYEDFLGGVTRTVTITGVTEGTKEQQYDVAIEGDSRVWRPAVTVLKLLVQAWGDEAKTWVGRRVTLYGDPDVTFGREKVGGIRVSHMSDLPGGKPMTANLTVTRGKRQTFTVQPLAAPEPLSADTLAALAAEFERVGVPEDKRLAGANHYANTNAVALDGLTEEQARIVLDVLASREDA